MAPLPNQHPRRLALANELHARPFPELPAPCRAVHIAFKPPRNAAERDPEVDRAHLRALIDRHGGAHPAPEADHYSGPLGRATLKWERHAEFVTYTLFVEGDAAAPFDGADFALFPADWLAEAPGAVIAAVQLRVECLAPAADPEAPPPAAWESHFARDSIAAARVVDGAAAAMSDFRIHPDGASRFLILARPDIGPRRLGRIVQRLLEIETYKSVSMLTLPVARRAARRLAEIDRALTDLMRATNAGEAGARETLDQLTGLSTEIETMAADAAFRFGAARAYAAIVGERIEALRERRLRGRQTFGDFMQRRYHPAMRTCRAAERRMEELSTRAARVADLLRTRVDVEMSAQNKQLLQSMDRRAALQLRLQETVEGLSVVAITYYAVSLAAYALAPLAKLAGVSKIWLTAALVPAVAALVWGALRRLRRKLKDR